MASAPDRWPVLRAAVRQAALELAAFGRRLLRLPGRVRMPVRILFAPRDLRVADPGAAQDMAAGIYVFGDRTMRIGATSPFAVQPPSAEWAEELYGFGWLRHLRLSETGEAQDLARRLVGEALGPLRRNLDRFPAREPRVAARRVASLLAHSPLLLSGASPALYRRYLMALGRDAARLDRSMRDAPVPADRLSAAIGLCLASLCCEGLERRLSRVTRVLSAELDAQVLADGGHVGRNPGTCLDLLQDLLPLRLLFATRSVPIPAALDRAIDRLSPMLRFFRHGSGDLALFNGMGRTPLADLAVLLSLDRERGAPALHAAWSGYDRMEAGGTVVLAETGAAPPLAASAGAHAGCLSFELSRGESRLVVNCGAPPGRGPARDAARLTAAHSTLVMGGEPSGRALPVGGPAGLGWAERFLWGRLGPVLVTGPRAVGAERGITVDGDVILSAHHDGYLRGFGATHERRLRLSADGRELAGADTLRLSQDGTAASALLRFHLHPSATVVAEPEGEIRIQGSAGDVWLFDAQGAAGAPRLEGSVFFAVSEGRRATRQIVLDLPTAGPGDRLTLRWRFRLLAG
ncbi:heparinase II/III family protein [Enterovirga sp.]|uniref:heparinase II/III family protein n=1 Tax=Enterovirga sp. TaxID=2026350 RepID=UPI00262C34E3|nr:heparinase II/III family protein [Enterovirga sp.]MDB5591690.1 heparinase [Enterovirga sp.]